MDQEIQMHLKWGRLYAVVGHAGIVCNQWHHKVLIERELHENHTSFEIVKMWSGSDHILTITDYAKLITIGAS